MKKKNLIMIEHRQLRSLFLTVKWVGTYLVLFNFCSCSESNEKASEHKNEERLSDKIIMPKVIDKESVLNLVKKFPELRESKITTEYSTFAIEGDFYGDGINDLAVLLTQNDTVKVCVISIGEKSGFHFLGTEGDELTDDEDYSWAGHFETVKAGEVLWSNYEEDFRSLEEVPENEKVKLKYDAIYVHAVESCGGAYIFWKNGKFNWLTQE
jgi:hypothetical protein